ncbi:hypothetical protein K402DRAFT_339435 [Aulographum hederae CBS 113979]|uniref:DUF3176 domain-containing protein n=1 Tax=Aulographum hederae CBS 113979 TaxID=1176131 RepID=A0A6G1GPQ8_9PEZI|nr:hypothetical protein K402DRAFT_339435 [Aulographum hederae CBS 113979]
MPLLSWKATLPELNHKASVRVPPKACGRSLCNGNGCCQERTLDQQENQTWRPPGGEDFEHVHWSSVPSRVFVCHTPSESTSSSDRNPGISRTESASSQGAHLHSHTFTAIVSEWWIELACWYISAMCLVSIFIALTIHNGRPLPQHWPLGINLNVYISVFSNVLKCSLLVAVSSSIGQLKWQFFRKPQRLGDFETFDDASRGPWGAALLLWRLKTRSLACVGAAIIILSISFDPLFQQVVAYPSRSVPGGTSSISRSFLYKPETPTIFISNDVFVSVDDTFMYTTSPFFHGRGADVRVPMHCPTSNCSWTTFETLGMCSSCTDTAHLLSYSCKDTMGDWLPPQNFLGRGPAPIVHACGWFLNATSELPTMMTGYAVDPETSARGEAVSMRMLPLFDYLSYATIYGASLNYKNIQNRIVDFFIASSPNGTEGTYEDIKPQMLECVLYWCTKTINASSTLGTYHEEVLEIYHNDTVIPDPWTPDDPITYYVGSSTMSPRGNETFVVSNDSSYSMITSFNAVLPSYISATDPDAEPQFVYYLANASNSRVRARALPYNPWLPENDISQHWADIATAMTNLFRSSPREGVEHTGIAWKDVVYVETMWVWLALPIALVLASLVFLILAMLNTTCKKNSDGAVGFWKNSALATLLHGLQEEDRKGLGVGNRKERSQTNVENLEVQLVRSEESWRLAVLPQSSWTDSKRTFRNSCPDDCKLGENYPLGRKEGNWI